MFPPISLQNPNIRKFTHIQLITCRSDFKKEERGSTARRSPNGLLLTRRPHRDGLHGPCKCPAFTSFCSLAGCFVFPLRGMTSMRDGGAGPAVYRGPAGLYHSVLLRQGGAWWSNWCACAAARWWFRHNASSPADQDGARWEGKHALARSPGPRHKVPGPVEHATRSHTRNATMTRETI